MQRMHCLFVSTRSILFFSSTFIAASSLAYSRSIAAPFPWTFQTSPKPPIGCDGRICTCVPPPPLGSDDRSHHASTLLAKTPCKCPKNKKKSRTSGYAQHRIESIRPNARARLRSPRCVEAWNAWHEACVRGNTRISHTTSINHSPAAELESASASIAGSLSYNSAVFGHPFLASFFQTATTPEGPDAVVTRLGPPLTSGLILGNQFSFLPSTLPKHAWTVNAFFNAPPLPIHAFATWHPRALATSCCHAVFFSQPGWIFL